MFGKKRWVLMVVLLVNIMISGCEMFNDDVDASIDKIEVDTTQLEDNYDLETFPPKDIDLLVVFVDGTEEIITLHADMITNLDEIDEPDTYTFTIEYEGHETTFTVTLVEQITLTVMDGEAVYKEIDIEFGEVLIDPDDLKRSGYELIALYTDANQSEAFDTDESVLEEMVLYGEWKLDLDAYQFAWEEADAFFATVESSYNNELRIQSQAIRDDYRHFVNKTYHDDVLIGKNEWYQENIETGSYLYEPYDDDIDIFVRKEQDQSFDRETEDLSFLMTALKEGWFEYADGKWTLSEDGEAWFDVDEEHFDFSLTMKPGYFKILVEDNKQGQLTTLTLEIDPDLTIVMPDYHEIITSETEAFTYDKFDDVIVLLDYIGEPDDGTVHVPSTIDGATVMKLGRNLFNRHGDVEAVLFESDSQLAHIGMSAFERTGLESIELPESVVTIGAYAFDWTQLQSLHLPKHVADFNPSNLTSTYIKTLSVASENQHYSVKDNVLFNHDQTTLIVYPGGLQDETYTVPASVERVGRNAIGNDYLSTLRFEEDSNLNTIERRAIRRVDEVFLPPNLQIIMTNAIIGYWDPIIIHIPELTSEALLELDPHAFSLHAESAIVVPDSLYDDYMEADDWEDYTEFLVPDEPFIVPEIEFDNIEADTGTITFDVMIDDSSEVGYISSIDLYRINDTYPIDTLSEDDVFIFDDLLSDQTYTLTISYVFGFENKTFFHQVSTEITTKAITAPEVFIDNKEVGVEDIEIFLNIEDVDETIDHIALRLEDDDGFAGYESDSDHAIFKFLSPDTNYMLEITYIYDLNDGEGRHTETITESITTEAYTSPSVMVDAVTWEDDTLSFDLDLDDPNNLFTLDSVILINTQLELLEMWDTQYDLMLSGLDSMLEYIILIDYTYNLQDGKGDREERHVRFVTNLVFEDLDEDTLIVSGYDGRAKDLLIPSTFKGKTVVALEAGIFEANTYLRSISVYEPITTIPDNAFANIPNIEAIHLPNTAQTIGDDIFSGLSTLETITISSELEKTLDDWFDGTVPESLKTIHYAEGASHIDKTLTQNDMNGITLHLANDWEAIANNQFAGAAYLTKIVIPSSVTAIGEAAFKDADALTSVAFEENSQLELIDKAAFKGTALTSIEIPASVKTIAGAWGEGAFFDILPLTTITFEENSQLELIETSAFALTHGSVREGIPKRTLHLPSTDFVIDCSAFYLNQFTIYIAHESKPDTWSEDWDSRFHGSIIWGYQETLESDKFIYAVSSNDTISILGLSDAIEEPLELVVPTHIDEKPVIQIVNGAFENDDRLLSAHLPEKVETIDGNAFKGTANLETVTFDTESNLKSINAFAFQESAIVEIHIPASVTIIGFSAFRSASDLVSITFDEDSQLETFGNNSFAGANSLISIHIPASVTTLENGTFQNTYDLQSIYFAEGTQLEFIGSHMFSSSDLSEIHIPSSVTSIGRNAFHRMDSLTSIYIPSSVETLGSDLFYLSDSVTIYTEHESKPEGWDADWNSSNRSVVWGYTETIDDGVMQYALSSNDTASLLGLLDPEMVEASLTVPSHVEGKEIVQIINYAFDGASSLTSIDIPETVTTIGWNAFYGLDALKSVSVHENSETFTSIDGVLFNKDITELMNYPVAKDGEEYEIPESVTRIGGYAFAQAGSLISIHIPANITNIAHSAFKDAGGLTSVTFEEGSQLEKIGDQAFNNATALERVHQIPASVTGIGEYAFRNAGSLTTITFEKASQLETIGDWAFLSTRSLTSIYIPASVTSIGNGAFQSTDTLTIYTEFETEQGEWHNSWNLNNRPVHWGVKAYDTTPENIQYARLSDDTIIIVGLIADSVAEDIIILSSIDGNAVKEIQAYAFKNHDYLTSVFIPDTVTVIGEQAFENYTGTINAQAEAKPENWNANWNPNEANVNWGYTLE